MRFANRRDGSEPGIVEYWRTNGAAVQDLTRQGKGCPDKLVGYFGVTAVAEIKIKKGELSQSQVEWGLRWRGGPIYLVRTIEDAAAMLKSMRLESRRLNRNAEKKEAGPEA